MTPPLFPIQTTGASTITPLVRVILNYANPIGFGTQGQEISAPLVGLSNAVETAFVLVPRESLPKIGRTAPTLNGRTFTTAEGETIELTGNSSAAYVRKVAATWLAVAVLLEQEEKDAAEKARTKADEDARRAKAKAEADAAAERDRLNRLEELADEYFDEPFDYLGSRKRSAVEEIYRLEKLADDSCGCI